MVEIVVKKHARCRYTTIQNWANNIYNLVTKRAMAYGDAADGMDRRQPRQPADDEISGRLHDGAGRAGRDSVDRLCLAGQHQDAGAKVVHCAPHTSSRIISKIDLQERRPGQLSRTGESRDAARKNSNRTSFATP